MFGRRGKSSETANSPTPKIVSPQINSESAPSNFNLDKISIKKKMIMMIKVSFCLESVTKNVIID